MIIVATVVYCVYIIVLLSYSAYILRADKIKPITYLIVILVNSFLLFMPIYITNFRYNIILMALYVVILSIETKIICKCNIIQVFFGVFSFAINFFAIRTIIIVLMSFACNESVSSIISNVDNRILITTLNMLIPIPYILFTRAIMKEKILGIALAARNTSLLSAVFLGVTFVNQMAVSLSLCKDEGDVLRNLYYHLTVSLFSIAIFLLVMVINLIYSNLKKVADNYSEKVLELKTQDLHIRDIEKRSKKDAMTGFVLRDEAIEKIKQYLEQKTDFFIVFIDIDGLKPVNDNFGHNEGDIYIKFVCEKIEEYLGRHLIARIGGDEILIVGKSIDDKEIGDTVKTLEEDIKAIAANNEKPYETSISYGIKQVDSESTLSVNEIIAAADDRMYSFKKSRRKNRN